MNDYVRRVLLIAFIIAIVFVTAKSALAVSIDDNDEFIVSPGDTIKGSFILNDYTDDTTISSDLRWLSFSENEYKETITPQGLEIIDNSILIPYFVTIPEDAEIGVYRTVIVIDDQESVVYLNVKLSVQKSIIASFFNFLKSLSIWWYIGSIIILGSAFTFYLYNND